MPAWVTLIGRLGKDAELRYTPAGLPLCSFSVAVNVPVRLNTGEWADGETMWFECSLAGDRAEASVARLKKGMRISVAGQLTTRTYQDRDGRERTVFSVRVFALDTGANQAESADGQPRVQQKSPRQQREQREDLPFE